MQRGKGVDVNLRLSLELFRRAAELGDAEAQGAMAMRMAFGLHHPNSFEGASIRHFGKVGVHLRWRQCTQELQQLHAVPPCLQAAVRLVGSGPLGYSHVLHQPIRLQ